MMRRNRFECAVLHVSAKAHLNTAGNSSIDKDSNFDFARMMIFRSQVGQSMTYAVKKSSE